MTDSSNVAPGDKVSWNWSGNQPEGKVAEVKSTGEVSMVSHRGNEVKKSGDGPENPAVKIDRPGNNVVKKANEIDIQAKGSGGSSSANNDSSKKEDNKESEKKENGDAQTGEKRTADDADSKKADGGDKPDAKQAKTSTNDDAATKANGDSSAAPAPKKKGRPAKGSAPAAAGKKKEPKKAATESGEPRRSGRVAAKSS